jgi:hypothetical protein
MGTIARSRYLFVVFCPVRALRLFATSMPLICKRAAMAEITPPHNSNRAARTGFRRAPKTLGGWRPRKIRFGESSVPAFLTRVMLLKVLLFRRSASSLRSLCSFLQRLRDGVPAGSLSPNSTRYLPSEPSNSRPRGHESGLFLTLWGPES